MKAIGVSLVTFFVFHCNAFASVQVTNVGYVDPSAVTRTILRSSKKVCYTARSGPTGGSISCVSVSVIPSALPATQRLTGLDYDSVVEIKDSDVNVTCVYIADGPTGIDIKCSND